MNDESKDDVWKSCCAEADRIEGVADCLQTILRLRSDLERAHVTYLLFLRAVETRREDLWKVNGIVNFETWLQSHHVINVASYRNFCVVSGMLTVEQLMSVGAEAADALAKFSRPTPEAIQKFVDRCESFRDVNGVAPSSQTSRQWVREISQRDPRVISHASRIAQLVEEVKILNMRLRQMTAERDSLKRKNDELRAKVQKLENKKVDRSRHVDQ